MTSRLKTKISSFFFFLMWHTANLSLNVASVRNDLNATTYRWMAVEIILLWYAACVNPGDHPTPRRDPCMYSYNCEVTIVKVSSVFDLISSYARNTFGQTFRVFAEEGRPDTVVEVWAQSEHC